MAGLGSITSRVYGKAMTNWYMQYRRLKKLGQRLSVDRDLQYLRSIRAELLQSGEHGYRLKVSELGLSDEDLSRLEEQLRDHKEVVVADVDLDGRLLSYFGPIEDAVMVTPQEFKPRRRFPVQLVARNGHMAVRKSYAGEKLNFVNEIKILSHLAPMGYRVPAIMDVDFENLTLTMSYIGGRVLREEMADHGAQVYVHNPWERDGTHSSKRREFRDLRAAEARKFLAQVVDEPMIEALYQEMCKIHAAGVVDIDVKYGNLIIEKKSKKPYWIDFEHATYYPKLSPRALAVLSRRDVAKFNLFFGTNGQTPANGRNKARRQDFSTACLVIGGCLSLLLQ